MVVLHVFVSGTRNSSLRMQVLEREVRIYDHDDVIEDFNK